MCSKLGSLAKKTRSMYASLVAVTHCTHEKGVHLRSFFMVNVGKSLMGMAQNGGHHNLRESICGGFKDFFGFFFPPESVGQMGYSQNFQHFCSFLKSHLALESNYPKFFSEIYPAAGNKKHTDMWSEGIIFLGDFQRKKNEKPTGRSYSLQVQDLYSPRISGT